MQIVKDLLKILSEGEKDEDIKLDILGNVYGFYKMSGGSGSSTLILETATLLAKEDIKVCIIDADPLSSFYINKFIGCEETQKTCNNSIMSRLMNSTLPIKNCLVSTPNENLKILGFGLQTGYKDIFNLDFDSINKLFLEAKEYFDVVLIDIPNAPHMEPVLSAVNISNVIYSMWNFNFENISKQLKIRELFAEAGFEYKFNSIIIGFMPPGYSIKSTIEKQHPSFHVLMEVPYVKEFHEQTLNYTSFLSSIGNTKTTKAYCECVDFLIREILNGIGGEESANS